MDLLIVSTLLHQSSTFMPPSLAVASTFTRFLTRISLRAPSHPIAAFSTSLRIMAQEYKLKGLSGLDLKNGEKREVEVEGIENGKVLLVKQGDKTHAMSSNCTHYGAPLKMGVLTPDGRLTCAWHGGNCYCPFLETFVLTFHRSMF